MKTIPWNQTKIIATIGPASSSSQIIEKLIYAGVDIFRLNLSHGTLKDHKELVTKIKQISARLNYPIGILVDIPGPKFRTTNVTPIDLREGDKIIIGDSGLFSLTPPFLIQHIKEGNFLYLRDGLIKLRILKVNGNSLLCKIINGGVLTPKAGINIPAVSLPYRIDITSYINFIKEYKLFLIAISFVKTSRDVLRIKRKLPKNTFIVSKIERLQALNNLNQILEITDGIMVARGDLGIETPLERLGIIQKEIINKARFKQKPVITATQMLASMLSNPIPTRAEVTDVTNAILDGADCLMLSEETAIGKYPVEAVSCMRKISQNVERFRKLWNIIYKGPHYKDPVTQAIVEIANSTHVKAIIVYADQPQLPVKLSYSRPPCPIIILYRKSSIGNFLKCVWGNYPVQIQGRFTKDKLYEHIKSTILARSGILKKGSNILLIATTEGVGGINKIELTQI